MSYLFTRTAAQGLQAFVPVAVLLLWIRRSKRQPLASAVASGLALALPATIAAGLLLARAQQQARQEAGLATITLGLAAWFAVVRGDIARRQVAVLRAGVECPSLSPDGRTIVFKKKVDARPDGWRFYALDVATLQERPTGATAFVDDQAEWLDNEHVLYALPRLGSADVYVARTDDSEPSRIFLHDAQSPVVVR
jgi:hypothetical protein